MVSIFFYLLYSIKVAIPLTRVEKNSLKLSAKGFKRNFVLIIKRCIALASRSAQLFFSQKNVKLQINLFQQTIFSAFGQWYFFLADKR